MAKQKKKLNVNRKFKDRMFIMIFSEKKALLDLYNAVNGTRYEDPDLLEINTLENAIYLGMKNDVSFIIDARMCLYEHQSTFSPNLPLRYLFYVSDLISSYTKDMNLYGRKKIYLPTPKFLVFYNGECEMEDVVQLRLSDSYLVKEETYSLELHVKILNINQGHNEKLLESCSILRDYAFYTNMVRELTKQMSIEDAVEETIQYCIKNHILADFLKKNRAEVKAVSIYEYDQEKHMQQERKDEYEAGYESGHASGVKEGHAFGIKEGHASGVKEGYKSGHEEGIVALIELCRELDFSVDHIQTQLQEKFHLSSEDAANYLK